MRTAEIILIALGLSMDAFAVSVTSGFSIKKLHIGHALRIALFFGGFQALMPILGWGFGAWIREYISGLDRWIAFGLLAAIGAKMIYEGFRAKGEDEKTADPLNPVLLLFLAVATSLDALAVGISLSFIKVSIISPAIIIGVVTFLLSLCGVYIGDKMGHIFENKIEAAGGLILIVMGLKIFFSG